MNPTSLARWVPFFFDGNQFTGWISGPQDWRLLRAAYSTVLKPWEGDIDDVLLSAKSRTYGGRVSQQRQQSRPTYGFRFECDGEPLADFFRRFDMTVPPKEDSRAVQQSPQ